MVELANGSVKQAVELSKLSSGFRTPEQQQVAVAADIDVVPKEQAEELVSGNLQNVVELASGNIQDAPSYACTFGHVIHSALGHGTYGKVFTAQRQNCDTIAIKHIECMPHEMPSLQNE